MSEVGTEGDPWLADRLFGTDPAPDYPDEPSEGQLDGVTATAVEVDASLDPPDPNAGATRTALWLTGVLVVAVVGIVTVWMSGAHGDAPPPPTSAIAPVTPAVAAAPDTGAPAPAQDRAIAYTASANCPAGSTSARSLSAAADNAGWTCVRGQQGARVDGQVLHVDLGGSYLLSAVTVTPGWVPKTPVAHDEWLQHRVVTRLQYVFDDAERTIFTQDTGNAHGPVTSALPTRVLAAKVTVIVLQTSRPPASPPASTEPPAPEQPGFDDSVLGAPPSSGAGTVTDASPTEQPGDDPVDATFTISSLSFLGHRPS